MYWLKSIHLNLISLSALFALQCCCTKSANPVEPFGNWEPVSAVVITATNHTQQHGLEPLTLHYNYSHQLDNNFNTTLKLVINADIKQNTLANNKVKKMTFNGHQGTRGIIALLFPFHGFT